MNGKYGQRKNKMKKRKVHKRKHYNMLYEYEDDSSSSGGELTPIRKANQTTNKSQQQDDQQQQNPSLLSSLRSVLIVISSALICFAAARNSITWHCQRFWGASGDFWQAQWDKFLDTFGEDPFHLWVYGTTVLQLSVYWLFGGIYTILDVTNKPAALRRYKIQPGTNEPVDNKRLCKVIWQVFVNQLVVGLPSTVIMYWAMRWRGFPVLRELPTFHWVLYELAVHILVEEAAFYYSHRLLHNRYLYKFIHKQHHEWTAPIAVTAVYCHPIEHLFSNLMPPFLGVFLMGSHVATAWLWFTLAILSTLNAHSGYHLPFFPSPEAHDFHHLKFNNCFGVLGVLDRLHGTDTNFRSTRLENFLIEVVTDRPVELDQHRRVREIVVPQDYRTKTGALFKARALQYCLEEKVNDLAPNDWIVHLDEETLLTENSVKGILNFVYDGKHQFGQGLITYANEEVVNWITTLADSFRVTDDMGKLKLQFLMFHKPLFSWKGSFVVTQVAAERAVSFDNGLEGSIAEDCFFAMRAYSKGYSFNFIEGEMWEKSPFTFWDFIQQRKRWIQGILLVVHSKAIPFKKKILLTCSCYSWLTLPLSLSNLFLASKYPIPCPPIIDFTCAFIGGVNIYMFVFGVIKSFTIYRFGLFRFILCLCAAVLVIPFNLIIENVAVIWGIFGKKHKFYVVNKNARPQITV